MPAGPFRLVRWIQSVACLFCVLSGWSQESAKPAQADRILVIKSTRTLTLLRNGVVLKSYKVALGGSPIGAKEREGDHKTPEGLYVIDFKKENSQFYKALHISYPNQDDRQRAFRQGVKPGSDIEIHGLADGFGWIGSRHRLMDWTDGCIALTNEEIDEIWNLVPEKTPIEIRP